MVFYVYLIRTLEGYLNKSYVGYTKNLTKRINEHNNNVGAKSTKGYQWELVYKKRFHTKNKALSFEYELKNNRKERSRIINDFIKNKN
jgi:putative endonuclease